MPIHGFRVFLMSCNVYGKSVCLLTANGLNSTNNNFEPILFDSNICREYRSVDSPKRNKQVERTLILVLEGGVCCW